MHAPRNFLDHTLARLSLVGVAAMALAACGGGDGPAISANGQTVTFMPAPILNLHGTATVSASASSGLPITYSSTTPFICSIDGTTGVVTALTTGNCIIAADQYGDATYAPARETQPISVQVNPLQTLTFRAPPTLTLYGTATVSAIASSGLPVSYSSLAASICAVDGSSGLVNALNTGDCIIAADQAGNDLYNTAPQVTQTLNVPIPADATVPEAPGDVKATVGSLPNTVDLTVGSVNSGGLPITQYAVVSTPPGIQNASSVLPVTVDCPASCRGYAFSVYASNAKGDGAPSTAVDVMTTYRIVETFREPATQPNDTIFTGSFAFNLTKGEVSNLAGDITQSMTGGCATMAGCDGSYGHVPMTTVPLTHQLSVIPATLGGVDGLLVTSFALSSTNTFFDNGGTNDGWSPQTGVDVGGIYYGFPRSANNPGNAYAMIFVNLADPTVPLVQAQLDKLAYADCTPGGMMGAACMTGSSVAGYGAVGTMSGYPQSQIITRQP